MLTSSNYMSSHKKFEAIMAELTPLYCQNLDSTQILEFRQLVSIIIALHEKYQDECPDTLEH